MPQPTDSTSREMLRLAHLSELTEYLPAVCWLTDATNSQMFYVSPAYERVFGRSCEALYANAHDWLNAVHPDDCARMTARAHFDEVRAPCNGRYRVVHPDGTIRTIDYKLFPIFDGDQAVRIAGVADDITDSLALEDQVRQTQRLESLGLLAGGIAHDFNNILSVISANASLLAESQPRSASDAEFIEEIGDAVTRATALTRQLLAFSRKQVVYPVVLDVNAAVNDTHKMLRRMVGEDVLIQTSLDPELARVKIDPGSLVQILMNLSVNARDAMPRGGTLRLATRNANRHEIVLSVTDTGCGMTPEIRARAFEPLFTTKGPGNGTGLGLSVVLEIVRDAGGRIELDSEVDVGTTFRVFLPSHDSTAKHTIATTEPSTRGTETVMLVDDDPYVRRAMSRALRSRGYEVLEADGARAALELLGALDDQVDLLVTDVVMPEMSGRTLAETVLRRRPSLDVLYMSGYTDDTVLRHGVEQAEVTILEKPIHGSTLATRVREILDRRRAREAEPVDAVTAATAQNHRAPPECTPPCSTRS